MCWSAASCLRSVNVVPCVSIACWGASARITRPARSETVKPQRCAIDAYGKRRSIEAFCIGLGPGLHTDRAIAQRGGNDPGRILRKFSARRDAHAQDVIGDRNHLQALRAAVQLQTVCARGRYPRCERDQQEPPRARSSEIMLAGHCSKPIPEVVRDGQCSRCPGSFDTSAAPMLQTAESLINNECGGRRWPDKPLHAVKSSACSASRRWRRLSRVFAAGRSRANRRSTRITLRTARPLCLRRAAPTNRCSSGPMTTGSSNISPS